MDDSLYAEQIRTMLRHENELINHRISWMATCNGLFLTAVGFAWGKQGGKVLAYVLAALGIAASASAWSSLYMATSALRRLRCLWEEKGIHAADVPPVIGYIAPRWLRWLLPWHSLPVVFAAAWLVVIVITAIGGQKPGP
ncbi:MAG: hypothetical protein ABSH37_16465 [Bryobacteraceae bacterium]|jgi:hypothetical protein